MEWYNWLLAIAILQLRTTPLQVTIYFLKPGLSFVCKGIFETKHKLRFSTIPLHKKIIPEIKAKTFLKRIIISLTEVQNPRLVHQT